MYEFREMNSDIKGTTSDFYLYPSTVDFEQGQTGRANPIQLPGQKDKVNVNGYVTS